MPLRDFTDLGTHEKDRLLDQGFLFDCSAIAIMNRLTFTHLRSNVNSKDMYGRRCCGNGYNLESINQMLSGDDLPQVVVYDHGVRRGVFEPFVPDDKVIVIARHKYTEVIGNNQLHACLPTATIIMSV